MTNIFSKTYDYPEYRFSVDWFSHNIPIWERFFTDNNLHGRPELRFLEIGCFEGRSTVYLLDNILTHKSSMIDVIDTFQGSVNETGMSGLDLNDLLDIFQYNTRHHKEKINIYIGESNNILRKLDTTPTYDIIYIDGSHAASDILTDAVLCHSLLKQYGLLIFDDYLWNDTSKKTPKIAIDSFLLIYEDSYEILWSDYQLICKKKT